MEHDPPPPPLLIGCAAGFSGDRTDAAGPVVETLIARLAAGPAGMRAFLIFETLAERTLALAQLRRRIDPEAGYEPLLDAILRPVLAACLQHRIRIVSNFGAAHPAAAARLIVRLARELGCAEPVIAVVEGDDLRDGGAMDTVVRQMGPAAGRTVVSANAYIGAEPIAAALGAGADIVVCGRVADPSLAVGPALSHFGWAADDWRRIGAATMAGHLLECGSQVCGGYFADPGYKDVPGLDHVGFPIAELDHEGNILIGKAEATGGFVNRATVTEQLLYEVHDPAAYLTPDVTADISQARVVQAGTDRVSVTGVTGHPRPADYKVNVCYEGGWLAEGEISYAGPRAEARARLAADVLRKRLPALALRVDLIGAVSVFGDDGGRMLAQTPDGGGTDIRLRVAATHADKAQAELLGREVVALYCCGPAGGGGVRTHLTPRLGMVSCPLPRTAVRTGFRIVSGGSADRTSS